MSMAVKFYNEDQKNIYTAILMVPKSRKHEKNQNKSVNFCSKVFSIIHIYYLNSIFTFVQ